MANFTNHILTTGGQGLIAQAHLGRKLTFTKIAVGSGNVATALTATALAAHQMNVGITSIQRDATNTNQVRVRGVFNNVSLTTGFNWREMGLFARIDSEPEVLYSYVADTGAGDLIPAYDGANPVIVYPTIIVIIESTIPIHADIVIGGDVDAENIGTSTVEGWFAQKAANTLQFKRPVQGDGIELTESADTITIGQRILTLDLDLYVPLDHPAAGANPRFPTIQAAWNSLAQTTIPAGRQATINVAEGIYAIDSGLDLVHPNSDRISIIGAPPVRLPLTGGLNGWSNAGYGPGNYQFLLGMASVDSDRVNVGDVIAIRGADAYVYDGAWRVVNRVAGAVTLLQTSPRTLGIESATPATSFAFWYPTRLVTNSRLSRNTINIGSPGLSALRNFAIRDTQGTGLYTTISIATNPSTLTLDSIAISGSDATAISAVNSGVVLNCLDVFIGDIHANGIVVSYQARLSTEGTNSLTIGGAANRGIWVFLGALASLTNIRSCTCNAQGVYCDSGSNVSLVDSWLQSNLHGLWCSSGSYGRVQGGWISGNTMDAQATLASTIQFDPGAGFGVIAPPANTVGNQNSIIIVQ